MDMLTENSKHWWHQLAPSYKKFRLDGFYLFDQVDTSKQVHAEINEGPIDAFLLIFFLFQYEHVMVEELLQFLIGEVDAKLLKTVELLVVIGSRYGGGKNINGLLFCSISLCL